MAMAKVGVFASAAQKGIANGLDGIGSFFKGVAQLVRGEKVIHVELVSKPVAREIKFKEVA